MVGVAPRGYVMKVWIIQEDCTGDGLCEEICPNVFIMRGRNPLAYAVQNGVVLDTPGGSEQAAVVPQECEDDVSEAAESCPGECIFVED